MKSLEGKPDGAFLIRDTTTLKQYTLYVQNGGDIKVIRIVSSNGKYGLTDPIIAAAEPILGSFSSVSSLVDYFGHTSLKMYNSSLDVTLAHPVSKFQLVSTVLAHAVRLS